MTTWIWPVSGLLWQLLVPPSAAFLFTSYSNVSTTTMTLSWRFAIGGPYHRHSGSKRRRHTSHRVGHRVAHHHGIRDNTRREHIRQVHHRHHNQCNKSKITRPMLSIQRLPIFSTRGRARRHSSWVLTMQRRMSGPFPESHPWPMAKVLLKTHGRAEQPWTHGWGRRTRALIRWQICGSPTKTHTKISASKRVTQRMIFSSRPFRSSQDLSSHSKSAQSNQNNGIKRMQILIFMRPIMIQIWKT